MKQNIYYTDDELYAFALSYSNLTDVQWIQNSELFKCIVGKAENGETVECIWHLGQG